MAPTSKTLALASLGLWLSAQVYMTGCAARDAETTSAQGVSPGAATSEAAPEGALADVLSTINRGADPCDDFYEFACGGWISRNPLPPDQGYWTRGVGALSDDINAKMRDVLDELSRKTPDNEDDATLGRFYAACMAGGDSALADLQSHVNRIPGSTPRRDFMRAVGIVHSMGASPFVRLAVEPDGESPGTMALHIRQGGLGLPALKYYSSSAEEHRAVLEAYRAHMASMLKIMGMPDQQANDAALAVVHFESALAGYQTEPSALRDPRETHHKLSVTALRKMSYVPWQSFLEGLGNPEITTVVVESPRYMAGIGMLLARTKPAAAGQYVRWHFVLSAAADVPELAAAHFDFYGKHVGGGPKPPPRDKRCVAATQAAMPVAFGRAYVQRFFDPGQRAGALEILQGVENALATALERATWADQAARTAAKSKLAALHNRIGHPEAWSSTGSFRIDPAKHIDNVFAANRQQSLARLAQVGKPVARERWDRSAAVVDASYSRRQNQLTVHAGLLGSPFFAHEGPPVMSFAALGQVVGRELMQGFDEQGRYFDAQGRLGDWWTEAVANAYAERAACIEKLYSAERIEPGLSIDGSRTLDDSLADVAGLQLAHAAYQEWARGHGGDEAPHVPGLTNEQLFFIAYAQAHCAVTTPEHLRIWVENDPRPPPPASINLPVASLPDFARAFECAPKTAMSPVNRCSVW